MTQSSTVRFGICGLGFMGHAHFKALKSHAGVEIVAVCDRDERRRSGRLVTAGNLDYDSAGRDGLDLAGAASYAKPEDLCADPNVDAVLITLPTPLHADVAVAALRAGKHVLTEKPMAGRPADCDRMIAAAEESGRTLMVAQCIRFWPHYEKIRELVTADAVGPLRFVTLRRVGSPPTYSSDNWLMDAEQSGGALLDLHVHDADFAHDFLGIPGSIQAHGARGPSGGWDHVQATWTYPDGRFVVIEGSWMFAPPWPFDMSITVFGERGTLHWQHTQGPDVLLYTGDQEPQRFNVAGDALEREQAYFLSCIRAGTPVTRCLPASSRASIVLAWLERRAIESGKIVHVDERLRAQWTE